MNDVLLFALFTLLLISSLPASLAAGDWEVRLFNDPMNKREYVARCLMETCGLSDGKAFQIMMNAHQNGAAVVGRWAFEQAEVRMGGD